MAQDPSAFINKVGSTFIWHENYSTNVDAQIKFYTTVLGFGSTEMDMAEMGTYKMLTKDGISVAGVLDSTQFGSDIPAHWATYISVEDVDSTLVAAEANGAAIMVPAMDVPTVGRMAMIKDPGGAVVWLFKPMPM